jgi:peptide-methionine (S)-S-oxide reductase
MTTYVLGGGCFWCVDAVFRRLKGVSQVVSGYTGGGVEFPDYRQVSSGKTGHAEVVQVTFDETVLPPEDLLDLFFLIHNPTTPNRQGADVGTQYRSIMLYADQMQKEAFEAAIERAKQHWDDPIVTELKPLEIFYEAEPEHQDYFNKNPAAGYCQIVIIPKIVKARQAYKELFE